jgi:Ca2+-binding RTX toxin-like protein
MPLYKGDGDNNIIFGSQTDDTIYGYGGDDTLIGGGGDDTIVGGTGKDTMDGGSGDDTYYVDNANDVVVEGANKGKDTIYSSVTYGLSWTNNVENLALTGSADINGYGNDQDNAIQGNSGDNNLFGFNGADTLKGGGGDDYLHGGSGGDIMIGGTGNDYYVVDSYWDDVTEYAGEGIDTVVSSATFYALDDNIEKLIMTGSAHEGWGNDLNNEIIGTGLSNYIDGFEGADTMKGGDGNDHYVVDNVNDVVVEFADDGFDSVKSYVTYTLGANVEELHMFGSANINGFGNGLDNILIGNSGTNVLYGYGGQDKFLSHGGADTLVGGQGDDVYGIQGDDVVKELASEGNDTVQLSGDLDYTLTDNVENLHLYGHGNGTGNALNNQIFGNDYDNVLDGGLGQDLLKGFDGNDVYYVDNALDTVIETANQGNDTVYSTVNHTLASNVEVLSLAVGNAVSGTGNDLSNTIYGNAGNNVLNGLGGADAMNGLGGNDTFVFFAGQANGDTVYEFEGNGAGNGDVLQFSGYGTAAQGATLTFIAGDTWQITSANGLIQETIHLVGSPNVGASDYEFV